MTVPTFDKFIEPVLRHLADRIDPVRAAEVHDAVADRLGLDDDQQAQRIPSGTQLVYKNRAGWAHDRLKRAGLSTSPRRGYWQLTEAGRDFAERNVTEIPMDVIKQMAFRPAQARLADDSGDDQEVPEPEEGLEDTRTPEERLRDAYGEIRDRLRGELLDLVRQMHPTLFEQLVLKLLGKMGYGASHETVQHTGGSGDGGIDGIISLDKLGLEKVYIQAKRYAVDNVIGRPEIQKFLGALAGRRATRGVFITTSRFSKEAREFAIRGSDTLVLINGHQLANYMIDFGVGVSRSETFTLVEIDGDVFEQG